MKRLPASFYFQVLLCSVLWGSAFPVIKNSYQILGVEGMGEQLVFAGSRFVLAGLLVWPFCRKSPINALRRLPKASLAMIVLGQNFVQYLFFYFALSVSSGALGALLVGTGSLWWIVLAPLILKSPWPSGKQWLALCICGVGVVVAVYDPGAGSGNVLLGSIAFLLTALSSAIGAIGMKKESAEFGSRSLTALSLFVGGILLLLAGMPSWADYFSSFSWAALGITAYLALLSATAFTVWNRLIEHYSVNVLSSYRFLIPLCGVVESSLFIEGESIGVGIVLGGSLILASLIGFNRTAR